MSVSTPAPVERRNPQVGYEGVYGKIQFPHYSFVEFPKWVRSKGREQLVQTAREELEVLTAWGEQDALLGEKNTSPTSGTVIDDALAQVKEAQEKKEEALAALAAKDKELEELKKQIAAAASAAKPATPVTAVKK